MKRILAVMLALVLMLAVLALPVAAETAGDTAEVYVTISDKDGKLVVTADKIALSDTDGDGALTINDALYLAHEKNYEGSAAAGYLAENTQYGLGLSKLWGSANGGSYGYYVNNASAWALTDPLNSGDHVYAFVYTDLIGWSDNYSYFDRFMGDVKAGESFELTLTVAGYDADWNPVNLPLADAEITVDGTPTGVKTDENGKATVTLSKNGTAIVSATSASRTIAPPIFVAAVTGGQEETETVAETTAETATFAATSATKATSTAAAKSGTNPASVKTGGSGILTAVIIMLIAFASVAVFISVRRKHE